MLAVLGSEMVMGHYGHGAMAFKGIHSRAFGRLGKNASLAMRTFISRRATDSLRVFGTTHKYSHARALEIPRITPEIPLPSSHDAILSSASTNRDIRMYLRKWQSENQNLILPILELRDFESKKGVNNSLSKQATHNDSFDESIDEQVFENELPYTVEDLIDFGNKRTFLQCGDMVELRTANNLRAELAIFVRELESQAQFYTMSGKWIHQKSQMPTFFIPRFVEPSQLSSLIEYLPHEDVSEALQDKLQGFDHALPRNIGAPLVRKMLDFWNSSDSAYRAVASKLDNAHNFVADESNLRYVTLSELAAELVPETQDSHGEFPHHVLYAVHRCLMQDDLGFRVQRKGNHRVSGQYEVSSLEEVHIVVAVTNAVRKYQEYTINASHGIDGPDCKGFLLFLAKARRIVKRSRLSRQFTHHGMLGPVNTGSGAMQAPLKKPAEEKFSGGDKLILRFVEAWCGLRIFNPSSHLNGIGSAILRATGMYEGTTLDQTTAWTFLQEIGALPPWATLASYDIRLPIAGIKPSEGMKDANTGDLQPDSMAGIRKDWGDLPVYCIDAVTASEIDDGVSLEHTEVSGQYWIHVHTADPASQIAPDTKIAKQAEAMAQNVYFPDSTTMMLPRNIVKNNFSLASHRPCLTFSAKINSTGELLDYRVTGGIVRNVLYLTPDTLDEIVGEKLHQVNKTRLSIGKSKEATTSRYMTEPHELSHVDSQTLNILYKLCKAHHKLTSLRGAIHSHNPDSSVVVDLGSTSNSPVNILSSIKNDIPNLDPSITLNFENIASEGSRPRLSAVAHMMLMAGNVAARWCHDRGIPIPFRTSQQNTQKGDPAMYFNRHILQLVKDGSPVPSKNINEYLRILGPVLPSTTSGPHLALGMDMYTKATSPLRRYSDLVVHWQVQAALLEEGRRNKSLIGNISEDFLPFSKEAIDKLLPVLDTREKILKDAQSSARRVWIMQALIRAWKFNEGEIPATFDLTVRSINRFGVQGRINSLGGFIASFDLPKWIAKDELSIGDNVEVEIEDLNVYTQRATMKPLRIVKGGRTHCFVDHDKL